MEAGESIDRVRVFLESIGGLLLGFGYSRRRRYAWLREDNVYTVCDSEVVSPGCYNAALVGYSVNWSLGAFSASAAGFSF